METDLTEQDRTPLCSAAHRWLALTTFAWLILGLTTWGDAATKYTYKTIDMQFPGVAGTTLHGTNKTKVKVGTFLTDHNGEHMSFRSGTNGNYNRLPRLEVWDINNGGTIVGSYRGTHPQTGEPASLGFLDTGSTFIEIMVPGMRDCYVKKVNNLGTVVGDCSDQTGNHAFRQEADGTYTLIVPPFESWDGFGATGISEAGAIVVGGYSGRGFLYWNPTFLEVDVPGADRTFPTAVIGESNIPTIIGVYCLPEGGCHGFKTKFSFDPAVRPSCCNWPQDFQQITYPGAEVTMPFDINEIGEIVGQYYNHGSPNHGFIAIPTR
jgi:hypothetical protein